MDFPAHLTSHASAELSALTQALALQHLGNLLETVERHLGESVIFDPGGQIKEQTIRDGIRIGKHVCRCLVAQASAIGLDPGKVSDQWPDIIATAIVYETNQMEDPRC